MIPKLTRIFTLTPVEQGLVNALHPYNGKSWKDNSIADVKDEILRQLLSFQNNNCCYCGLKVNETGRGELDHILKKGGPKRPAYVQYVFTPHNLAVSCQYCNSSSKKGQEDVIDIYDAVNYSGCTFTIVHPYFSDPGLHYRWSRGPLRILITALSNEGRNSIRIFDLDKEPQTTARAKQASFEQKQRRYHFPNAVKDRIKAILLFRRN
jgi:uncharacterized protein (TIGR02646 family)